MVAITREQFKKDEVWNKLFQVIRNNHKVDERTQQNLIPKAHIKAADVVSLLPTVTARDFRSPGKKTNLRLNGSRGLPLTEDLGSQLHPELAEALMGFPIGWTELSPSETQSFRKSRSKSSKQSKQ